MSRLRTTPPTGRIAALAALLVLVVCAVWPFVWVVGVWPTSRDAVLWIVRGDPFGPRFWSWTFAKPHFNVGFRPVTALSYSADVAVGGHAAWTFGTTDLLFHAGVVAGVYLLFRRLWPLRPRWGGLVAAAVVAIHPAAGLVVPHLARRSYSLASALSLFGLTVLAGPVSAGATIAAVVLLAAGAWSNEAAYVAFPVAVLLVLHRCWDAPDRWRAAVRGSVPVVATLGVLLVHRLVLLHGLGGYETDLGVDRILAVVGSTWSGLVGVARLRSDAVAPSLQAEVLLAVVGVSSAATVAASARRLDEGGRAQILVSAWLLGLFLVYAPQGVYFPRQVYMLVPALGLLVGAICTTLVEASWALPVRWALAAPQIVLLVSLLRQSPVVRGPDPLQRAGWVRTDALLEDLDAALATLPTPTTVDLVAPHWQRPSFEALRKKDGSEDEVFAGRQLVSWLEALHPGVTFTEVLLVVGDPLTEGAALTLVPDGSVRAEVDARTLVSGRAPSRRVEGQEQVLVPARSGAFLIRHDGLTAEVSRPEGRAR